MPFSFQLNEETTGVLIVLSTNIELICVRYLPECCLAWSC